MGRLRTAAPTARCLKDRIGFGKVSFADSLFATPGVPKELSFQKRGTNNMSNLGFLHVFGPQRPRSPINFFPRPVAQIANFYEKSLLIILSALTERCGDGSLTSREPAEALAALYNSDEYHKRGLHSVFTHRRRGRPVRETSRRRTFLPTFNRMYTHPRLRVQREGFSLALTEIGNPHASSVWPALCAAAGNRFRPRGCFLRLSDRRQGS